MVHARNVQAHGAPRVCGDDPDSAIEQEEATRGAPRVCGDDPLARRVYEVGEYVLPAYAGMIPTRG